MATTVFVSYRRSDVTAHAGRVADRLRAHPTGPTIFFDTDAIGPGDPWRKRIDDALMACDVMLIVIGPTWLAVESGAAQPRLFDPNDVVAYEISAAMARGIRIVPLLVAGTKLPSELPAKLEKLLDSNAFEIRDGAFDRDMRELEGWILPPVPGRKGRWASVAAVVTAVAVGVGWFVGTPNKPHVLMGKPMPAEVKVELDLSWEPNSTMQVQIGEPARFLELALEEPERQSLLLKPPASPTPDTPARFVNPGLKLPGPGSTMFGAVARVLDSALKVDGKNIDATETRVCLKVLKASPSTNGRLSLVCHEGKSCVAQGTDGLVVSCGTPGKTGRLRLLDLIPSAMAQASVPAASLAVTRPAPGDWLIPQIGSLRERRGTPQAVAFSEVLLTVALPAPVPGADEITYEIKVNGRRLWVNGLAAWTHAVPLKAGTAAQLAFGLENLDSSGADRGREKLEVLIVQLAKKHSVAEDSVTLDFVALRDLDEVATTTDAGVPVRWLARYYPAATDRYQLFAYGGDESDTLAARSKFDEARAPASAAAAALALIGVVRPPNKDNKAWGLGVGVAQPNGQLRFSFDAETMKALCAWMNQPAPARRLAAKGFPAPSTFLVREIAVETKVATTRVPSVACGRFGAN